MKMTYLNWSRALRQEDISECGQPVKRDTKQLIMMWKMYSDSFERDQL